MRGVRLLFVITVMLVLSAGISYAAFDNSHHDMRSYVANANLGCFACHGFVTTSSAAALDNAIGTVGGLCLARCHVGGVVAGAATNELTPSTGPSVNPADYSTSIDRNINIVYFDGGSHGRYPNNLKNPSFGAAPAALGTWPTTATQTWPYLTSTQTVGMQCTSCHAVHDNKNAPFLWSPLAPTAANGVDGFCDKCHAETGRRGSIAAAPSGNHPVNMLVNRTTALGRALSGDTNGRRARRITIQTYSTANVFDVANVVPNTLIGPHSTTTTWNSGGHVVGFGDAATQGAAAIAAWDCATTTQVAGCFTCHAAHRVPQNSENSLVNVATLSPTTVTFNPLCVGCHGDSTTVAADSTEWKVGSTNYGHPVGDCTAYQSAPNHYLTSVGNLTFDITVPTFSFPQNGTQFGGNGRVLCTTCHKVHGGQGMALTNLGQSSTYAAGAICKQCHNGVGIPNVLDISKGGAASATNSNKANAHHVTRATALSYGAGVQQTGEGTLGTLYIQQPSWATSGGAGDIAVSMDCADCHVFNKTAHNW